MSKKKANGVHGPVVERTIEVDLGPDEVAALAAAQADRELELIRVETEKREVSSVHRKAIREIREVIATVAGEISTWRGARTLKVVEVKAGTSLQSWSPDGAKMYAARPLTAEELQDELDFAEDQEQSQ